MKIFSSWYLEEKYEFISGCEKGTECSNGMICGDATDACTSCSFEDCMLLAENRKAVAFTYRGTGLKWCRFCSHTELQNIRSTDFRFHWGVYARKAKYGNVYEKLLW